MKKKELLKRIEYLEMLVADLQTGLINLEDRVTPKYVFDYSDIRAISWGYNGCPIYLITKATDNTKP